VYGSQKDGASEKEANFMVVEAGEEERLMRLRRSDLLAKRYCVFAILFLFKKQCLPSNLPQEHTIGK
jgi:hypothetical protein